MSTNIKSLTDIEIVIKTLQTVEGVVSTTSRKIATVFGKDHSKVLKTIRELDCSKVFAEANFSFGSYIDENNQNRPEYEITRDGATFLISRFTGVEAARWMESYISAFNQMEQALLSITNPITAPQLQFTPTQIAKQGLSDFIDVGDLLGVPRHYSATEGVKYARDTTGVDYAPLLAHSPMMDNIQPAEVYLEVTELGAMIGCTGAQLNVALKDSGLQVKTETGWVATPLGEPYSIRHAWSKGSKSGYNLKWSKSFIEAQK